MPSIFSIERHSVGGQKAGHDSRYGHKACSQQQMHVIRHKRPGKAIGFGFRYNAPETAQNVFPITVGPKYPLSFNSPYDDVVQGSKGVYSGLARHFL